MVPEGPDGLLAFQQRTRRACSCFAFVCSVVTATCSNCEAAAHLRRQRAGIQRWCVGRRQLGGIAGHDFLQVVQQAPALQPQYTARRGAQASQTHVWWRQPAAAAAALLPAAGSAAAACGAADQHAVHCNTVRRHLRRLGHEASRDQNPAVPTRPLLCQVGVAAARTSERHPGRPAGRRWLWTASGRHAQGAPLPAAAAWLCSER